MDFNGFLEYLRILILLAFNNLLLGILLDLYKPLKPLLKKKRPIYKHTLKQHHCHSGIDYGSIVNDVLDGEPSVI